LERQHVRVVVDDQHRSSSPVTSEHVQRRVVDPDDDVAIDAQDRPEVCADDATVADSHHPLPDVPLDEVVERGGDPGAKRMPVLGVGERVDAAGLVELAQYRDQRSNSMRSSISVGSMLWCPPIARAVSAARENGEL
jgi:hypothetical protein